MKEEKQENPFKRPTQPSMKRRSNEHDYTSQCFYMVTMAVEGRRPLLGSVIGQCEAPADSVEAPRLQPTPLGEAVREAWWAISSFYPQVAVVALQLMPDHLHGILYFREATEGLQLGDVIRGFKAGCNRAYRAWEASVATMSQRTGEGRLLSGGGLASGGLASGGGGLASGGGVLPSGGGVLPSPCAATVSQRKRGLLWEKGYNDRILHNYHTLARWKAYLQDNPRRLLVKREHPDFFRVQRNVQYAGMTFSAIGNRFLLDHPQKVQVQCSRRITDEALAALTSQMLAMGAAGAVFVSPCISKGEKTIMRAVFDAGYPVVFLQENGITDLAKPGGRRFDACARGQMLILAPWEHHNERLAITRDKCMMLNEMARRICE